MTAPAVLLAALMLAAPCGLGEAARRAAVGGDGEIWVDPGARGGWGVGPGKRGGGEDAAHGGLGGVGVAGGGAGAGGVGEGGLDVEPQGALAANSTLASTTR